MFFEYEILGDRLPHRVLCLTYDDGPGQTDGDPRAPGPRTAELGAYLRSQGVAATFFAVGKFASQPQHGAILAGLRAAGHLVGNHTFDHPSLPIFEARGGDVVAQLERTTRSLGAVLDGGPCFFRPPYGDWRLKGRAASNVAAKLNGSPLAACHVGPIGWDIDAGDVGFWRDGRSCEECAADYLEAVERVGRGIVLMHDSTADIDELRPRNQALGLARILIPELLRRGYRFVRLDQIPQVAAAGAVSELVELKANDGRAVACPRSGTEVVLVDCEDERPDAVWGVVLVGEDQWTLRAPGGRFLSVAPGGQIAADADTPGEAARLRVERGPAGRIGLRTVEGRYLATERSGNRLAARDRGAGDGAAFYCTSLF
jgi:peptidoglycan/xylan/chitin deacetylase (PgdA/CDA1 family)